MQPIPAVWLTLLLEEAERPRIAVLKDDSFDRKDVNMKIHYVVLYMFLAVLFAPFHALADGWVLWEKGDVIKKGLEQSIYWNIINAYPLYEQCAKAKVNMWQHFKKEAEEDKQTMGVVEVKTAPDLVIKRFKEDNSILSWSQTVYCLPGTLDPRERK